MLETLVLKVERPLQSFELLYRLLTLTEALTIVLLMQLFKRHRQGPHDFGELWTLAYHRLSHCSSEHQISMRFQHSPFQTARPTGPLLSLKDPGIGLSHRLYPWDTLRSAVLLDTVCMTAQFLRGTASPQGILTQRIGVFESEYDIYACYYFYPVKSNIQLLSNNILYIPTTYAEASRRCFISYICRLPLFLYSGTVCYVIYLRYTCFFGLSANITLVLLKAKKILFHCLPAGTERFFFSSFIFYLFYSALLL